MGIDVRVGAAGTLGAQDTGCLVAHDNAVEQTHAMIKVAEETSRTLSKVLSTVHSCEGESYAGVWMLRLDLGWTTACKALFEPALTRAASFPLDP
jgi:hypothetical protein